MSTNQRRRVSKENGVGSQCGQRSDDSIQSTGPISHPYSSCSRGQSRGPDQGKETSPWSGAEKRLWFMAAITVLIIICCPMAAPSCTSHERNERGSVDDILPADRQYTTTVAVARTYETTERTKAAGRGRPFLLIASIVLIRFDIPGGQVWVSTLGFQLGQIAAEGEKLRGSNYAMMPTIWWRLPILRTVALATDDYAFVSLSLLPRTIAASSWARNSYFHTNNKVFLILWIIKWRI